MRTPRYLPFMLALLASTAVVLEAQQWEPYPQGGFSPHSLAVHPDGSAAYASSQSTDTVRIGILGGTVWNDIPLPTGLTRADHVAVGPDGTVYFAGIRFLDDGITRASRIWRSTDEGQFWEEIVTFLTASVGDIAVDAAGNVFFTTSVLRGTTPKYPLRSHTTYMGVYDSGAPFSIRWTLVDEHTPASNYTMFGGRLSIQQSAQADGQVWVAGYAVDAKTLNTKIPVVRRSLDGGDSWDTVSNWPVPTGYSFKDGSWDVAATSDVNGVAYVSASYGKKSGKNIQRYWLTYRSVNGGVSWSLVNSQLQSGYGGDIVADALGRVFTIHSGVASVSDDGGNSWPPVPVPGAYVGAADLVGNVFISGWSTEGMIHKLPAPAN
jgi:hypothetical protein